MISRTPSSSSVKVIPRAKIKAGETRLVFIAYGQVYQERAIYMIVQHTAIVLQGDMKGRNVKVVSIAMGSQKKLQSVSALEKDRPKIEMN